MNVLTQCKIKSGKLLMQANDLGFNIPAHNRGIITRALVCQHAAKTLGMESAAERCDNFVTLLLLHDAAELKGDVPPEACPWAGLSEAAVEKLKEKSEVYMAELDG